MATVHAVIAELLGAVDVWVEYDDGTLLVSAAGADNRAAVAATLTVGNRSLTLAPLGTTRVDLSAAQLSMTQVSSALAAPPPFTASLTLSQD